LFSFFGPALFFRVGDFFLGLLRFAVFWRRGFSGRWFLFMVSSFLRIGLGFRVGPIIVNVIGARVKIGT